MILPVYAGLERIPNSLLEASADLGARSLHTFFRVILPLAFPAVVAGSIFTFSLTLGDYIAPGLITSEQFIGTVIYRSAARRTAARRRVHVRADRDHDPLPVRGAEARGLREPLMVESLTTRILLRLGAAADARLPVRAARRDRASTRSTRRVTQGWPIQDWRHEVVPGRVRGRGGPQALWLSVQAAFLATLVAMVLGTLPRSGSRGTASSGARRSRSSSSCRSHCRGSSPGSRSRRRSRTSASRSGC